MIRFIKSLTKRIVRKGGRNNKGKITVRHRGGGKKRLYKKIDFERRLLGLSGRVIRIEKDCFRTASLALVYYPCGLFGYILAYEGINIGDEIKAGTEAFIKKFHAFCRDDITQGVFYVDIKKSGGALPLKAIPLGMNIHNVECS